MTRTPFMDLRGFLVHYLTNRLASLHTRRESFRIASKLLKANLKHSDMKCGCVAVRQRNPRRLLNAAEGNCASNNDFVMLAREAS